MPILDVQGLNVSYGMIQAVQDVTITVEPSEIVTLVGPNGAGKTSTLLAIAGLIRSKGGIAFKGRSIAGVAS